MIDDTDIVYKPVFIEIGAEINQKHTEYGYRGEIRIEYCRLFDNIRHSIDKLRAEVQKLREEISQTKDEKGRIKVSQMI